MHGRRTEAPSQSTINVSHSPRTIQVAPVFNPTSRIVPVLVSQSAVRLVLLLCLGTFQVGCSTDRVSPEESNASFRLTDESSPNEVRERYLEAGDVDAARWLLEKVYVGKKWDELDQTDQTELGQLLECVYQESPDDSETAHLYLDFLSNSGRRRETILVLQRLGETQPIRLLQAAQTLRQLGESEDATSVAQNALQKLELLFAKDPKNVDLSIGIARCQRFLFRYSEAIQTLRQSLDQVKLDESRAGLSRSIGRTYVLWRAHAKQVQSLNSNETDASQDSWSLLTEAIRWAPNDPIVLKVLADELIELAFETDEAKRQEQMQPLDEVPEAFRDLVKGVVAFIQNETDEGDRYLDLAVKSLPANVGMLNNLADTLSTTSAGAVVNKGLNDAALRLSNAAIARLPNENPAYLMTRGQILFRMERYREAIADLEQAVGVPELQTIAKQLLEVCESRLNK